MAKGTKKMRVNRAMTTTRNIPEDITLDILSRLPVKTLQRFKCVCKSWNAHITNPAFVKMHLSRSLASNSNVSLILAGSRLYSVDLDACEEQTAVELDDPLQSPMYRTQLLGSCNGLLCISKISRDLNLSEEGYYEEILFWNPCTRRHKKLPIAPMEFPRTFPFQSGIISHHFVYGFGYDTATDDYKLVRVEQSGIMENSVKSKVMVYSLGTNSWRRCGDMPFRIGPSKHDSICGAEYGVFTNSAIHWVANPWNWKPGDAIGIVVAFDLKNEEYRKLPVPKSVDKMFYMKIGVLGGQLCMLCSICVTGVEVWVMKDYGVSDSWVKLFVVDECLVRFATPISYLKNGKVILERWENLFLYDPLKQPRTRDLRIRGVPLAMKAEIYIQSLVSPESKMELNKKERKKKKQRLPSLRV